MKSVIKAAQPFFSERHKACIMRDFEKILSSGRLIFGPFTSRFEEAFSRFHGCRHAVAVHSCSAALEISLRYAGIKGFEAVVPTNTFVATAFSVLKAGGKLVLSDIEPEYCGLSIAALKKRLTRKTRVVVAVHLGGYIAPWMPEIRDFCKKKSLTLIEDCAHAHGAELNDKLAGTFGASGCFSFYPTKVMTSGVGGCVLTNDSGLARFAKGMRHFGEGKGLGDIRYEGANWIMDEFRSVVAYYQLEALPENLKKRRQLAEWYAQELDCVKGIRPLRIQGSQSPAYYRFLSFLDKGIDKKRVLNRLRRQYGIEAGSLYDPPVHRQPYFLKEFRFKQRDFAAAEEALSRQIALPMHACLSRSDIIYTAKALREILK